MDDDRKVSLPQFVLHEHSVLGLCFAREAPPPVGVGCCCVCSDGLSVRHRLFVLSLSVCATLLLSVYVSLGLRSSGSALLLTVCFVAPVVILTKATIGTWSAALERRLPSARLVGLRAEELTLLGWFIWAIAALSSGVEGGGDDDDDDGELSSAGEALGTAAGALAVQWAAEVVTLCWCYLYCRCCCACCLPERRHADLNYPLTPAQLGRTGGRGSPRPPPGAVTLPVPVVAAVAARCAVEEVPMGLPVDPTPTPPVLAQRVGSGSAASLPVAVAVAEESV